MLKLEKLKYHQQRSSIFKAPIIVKQKFWQPEFATALFFACIRCINKISAWYFWSGKILVNEMDFGKNVFKN